jgi:manganese/zinc/iron transport system permease protein
LSITTFDADLALALGYRPSLIHLVLVSLASMTAVAAFDAVGPLLVVSFFVVPAATARLLTNRLSTTLIWSLLIGTGGAVGGTWLAFQIDTTVAGTVASLLGLVFSIVAFGTAITRRTR